MPLFRDGSENSYCTIDSKIKVFIGEYQFLEVVLLSQIKSPLN